MCLFEGQVISDTRGQTVNGKQKFEYENALCGHFLYNCLELGAKKLCFGLLVNHVN